MRAVSGKGRALRKICRSAVIGGWMEGLGPFLYSAAVWMATQCVCVHVCAHSDEISATVGSIRS